MSTIENQILKENPAWFAQFLQDIFCKEVGYLSIDKNIFTYSLKISEIIKKYPKEMLQVAVKIGYLKESKGTYFLPSVKSDRGRKKRREIRDYIMNHCLLPDIPENESYKEGMEILSKDPQWALRLFNIAESEYETTYRNRPSMLINKIREAQNEAKKLIK